MYMAHFYMFYLDLLVLFMLTEQQRLVHNYIQEACAIRKDFLGNRSCDISITPSKLDIPMVPCNFIPIQPRLYSGKVTHLPGPFSSILNPVSSIPSPVSCIPNQMSSIPNPLSCTSQWNEQYPNLNACKIHKHIDYIYWRQQTWKGLSL